MSFFLSYVLNEDKADPYFLGHTSLVLTQHIPPGKPRILCKIGLFESNQVELEDKMYRPEKGYTFKHKTYPITTAEMTRFLHRVNNDRRVGLIDNPTRKRSSEMTFQNADGTKFDSTPGGPEFDYFRLNCKTYALSVMSEVGIVDSGLSNWLIDIPNRSGALHDLQFETTNEGRFWTSPMVISKRAISQTFDGATKKEIEKLKATVMANDYINALNDLLELASADHLNGVKGITRFRRALNEINKDISNPKINITRKRLFDIQLRTQRAITSFENTLKQEPNRLAKRFLDTAKDILNYLLGIDYSISAEYRSERLLHGFKKTINTGLANKPSTKKSKAKQTEVVKQTLNILQENEAEVPAEFLDIPPEEIHNIVQEELLEQPQPYSVIEGKIFFSNVLAELDKYKDQLGGSPVFGSQKPTVDDAYSRQFFLGIPMSAVRDWFTMTLKTGWRPKTFWSRVAKAFGIRSDNMLSQYEEAYTRIQRFGILIANKEYFSEILKQKDAARFNDLCIITGLAWHPNQNSAAVENMYIEFVGKFLTDDFEHARNQGPEAMIAYFKAFEGVCFEDRVRSLEEFSNNHPLEQISIPGDWDTSLPVEEAYLQEAIVIADKIKSPPNAEQLYEQLLRQGVFDLEFPTALGHKEKPTKEKYFKWAQGMVDDYVLTESESTPLTPRNTMW